MNPTCLIILDGFGVAAKGKGNAISLAHLPNYEKLLSTYPSTTLLASGEAVGLPKGEPGNSEVGHLNIGSGRIVYEDVTRVNLAIADRTLEKNPVLEQLADHVTSKASTVHLVGLVGGRVHSSLEHLFAILWTLKAKNCNNILLHIFTDGRDSPPNSAMSFIHQLTTELRKLGVGRIASVSGRYWGMDRDHRLDRTEESYSAIIGEGKRKSQTVEQVVMDSYKKNIFDEFIEPTVIEPGHTLEAKDAVFFFNFRPDRARQMVGMFLKKNPENFIATLTEYDKSFQVPVLFPPLSQKNTLAEVISDQGLSQLHIAETEKYAHVTYFFNGGREEAFAKEERVLIPSPKVTTYDRKPEMSAVEITQEVLRRLQNRKYNFLLINFANPDMLGHTGETAQTVRALNCVDQCLGEIVAKVKESGGTTIVTSDHGNAEQMIGENGIPDTAHTTNPVPIVICSDNHKGINLTQGILADVSPTILKLMGITKPAEMTGRSLI